MILWEKVLCKQVMFLFGGRNAKAPLKVSVVFVLNLPECVKRLPPDLCLPGLPRPPGAPLFPHPLPIRIFFVTFFFLPANRDTTQYIGSLNMDGRAADDASLPSTGRRSEQTIHLFSRSKTCGKTT